MKSVENAPQMTPLTWIGRRRPKDSHDTSPRKSGWLNLAATTAPTVGKMSSQTNPHASQRRMRSRSRRASLRTTTGTPAADIPAIMPRRARWTKERRPLDAHGPEPGDPVLDRRMRREQVHERPAAQRIDDEEVRRGRIGLHGRDLLGHLELLEGLGQAPR